MRIDDEKAGRNWDRMADLTRKKLNVKEEKELSYRLAVQNYYASTGRVPDDFIEPGDSR